MKCPVCTQAATPLGPLGWGGEREWLCPTGVKFRSHADHSISLMPQNHPNVDAESHPISPTYTNDRVEEATRYLVGMMNSCLRMAKVDYEFNVDDAWFDMHKRLQQGGEKG